MGRIKVLGGTGYAGGNIVAEAARRGGQVTAYSRTAPAYPVEGVSYVHGNVLDADFLDEVLDDADVVVHALSPRGELEGEFEKVAADVADGPGALGSAWG